MSEFKLGPIIGGVTHKKARIWFYGIFNDGGPAPYCHVFKKDKRAQIKKSPFKFEEVSNKPYEEDGTLKKAYVAEIEFPNSGEEFSFGINYDPKAIGTAELKYNVKRFPKDDDECDFSFGLISCHRPQKKKLDRIANMWGRLFREMGNKKSSFLIQAGDQVYCDCNKYKDNNAWEKSLKLFKKSSENDPDIHKQMVDYYRKVYFNGWEFKEVQELMSTFPQYMIWDDHDITDGWGSRKSHHKEKSNLAAFEAAKEVYYKFQHCHNPDPLKDGKFYYAFHYGKAAFLTLDIRGERNMKEKKLISEEQWTEIDNWLNSDKVRESKILFVISSVPVYHLSRSLVKFIKPFLCLPFFNSYKDDLADQWTYGENRKQRQILMEKLLAWSGESGKPVFILAGDVHVGTEVFLKVQKTGAKVYQISSSPITNNTAPKIISYFQKRSFRSRLKDTPEEHICIEIKEMHKKRNFAIIEVKYINGEPTVTLNMFKEGSQEPVVRNFIEEGNTIEYKKCR